MVLERRLGKLPFTIELHPRSLIKPLILRRFPPAAKLRPENRAGGK